MSNKRKSRLWNLLLKSLLVIAVGYLVYSQILKNQNLENIKTEFFNAMDSGDIWYICLVLLIMPFNWVLEAVKWRKLLSEFVDIGFNRSLKAVMTGITLAVVTPGRIGEYGGRITHLEAKYNWPGLVATFVSSLSQNLANLIFGFIGTLVFLKAYLQIQTYAWWGVMVTGLTVILIIVFVYLNVSVFRRFFKSILPRALLKRAKKPLKMLTVYKRDLLNYAFVLSVFRYVIYTSQYVLVLYAFGLDIPIIASISGVSMIFLFQSGIPLPPFLGILARGELALFVWSTFSENVLGILAATFALWFINLIIPTLIGLFFVLRVNIIRSFGYDK